MKYKMVKLSPMDWAIWKIIKEDEDKFTALFVLNSSKHTRTKWSVIQTFYKDKYLHQWQDISTREVQKYKLETL